ncbi:MAG: UDP-3-O-(3-hydroxymyristoyl)glucosamine N-acyltransferase [Calditrichota bacterium]
MNPQDEPGSADFSRPPLNEIGSANFSRRLHPTSTGDLALKLGCRLEGRSDLIIQGAQTLEAAGPENLTFLANSKYKRLVSASHAGCIIIAEDMPVPESMARLVSANPYRDFRRAIDILYETDEFDAEPGVHPSAVIDSSAKLGQDLRIGPFVHFSRGAVIGNRCIIHSGCFIGRDSVLGEDCVLGVNVVIRHNVKLGHRVRIGDGSVIGYDGFGYTPEGGQWTQIFPVGIVVLEDDVHLGANCCVDRATIGETRIGPGAKLDNLIQIAHGVSIGSNTAIAAQTGISGSTKIGSGVMMGGQVGIVGHVEIGDGVIIGAQSGVTKNWDIKGMIFGTPARPHPEIMRIEAALGRLPEILKRMKVLENRIQELEAALKNE